MRRRLIVRLPAIVVCVLAAQGLAPAIAAPRPLPMALAISPSPMPADAPNATAILTTMPGAECAGAVTYADGSRPAGWAHITVKRANAAGQITWSWHHQSPSAGTVTVFCVRRDLTR